MKAKQNSMEETPKARPARFRFTVAQVEDALTEALTQSGAARLLTKKHGRPCARSTVCNYVKRHERLRRVFEECQESMIDEAENALLNNVKAGKEASIIFLLKTKGQKRGYSERVDHQHSGETVLKIRYPDDWGTDTPEEASHEQG